jgi:hypothetical protein
VTIVVLASLGTGLGVVGVLAGLRSRQPSLETVFAALDREVAASGRCANSTIGDSARIAQTSGIPVRAPANWSGIWRLDRFFGAHLETLFEDRRWLMPTLYSRLGSALEVTGTSLETLCSQAVLGGIVGLFLPVACWGVISLGGLRIPLAVPVCGGVLLAGAGVLLPIAVLWTEARRRRRETRRVVGTFLDLVVLCLAGGMGIEGALHAAAQVGDDDVSARLLAALTLARDSGDSPWDALAGLGTELGVSELPELAAAVKLAGTQGARIRSTLSAKAASIRRHELADAEAEANAVTERLFLPGVLLLIGFLLFIGYPAVARITSGF